MTVFVRTALWYSFEWMFRQSPIFAGFLLSLLHQRQFPQYFFSSVILTPVDFQEGVDEEGLRDSFVEADEF